MEFALWLRKLKQGLCINLEEKTLESPLDCKEIQPIHSKGDQSWVFFGRNDAKTETPILRLPHAKSWFIGKDSDAGRDWGQEEKGTTEDEMAGWHHQIKGCEFEWTPGVDDGQGGLACWDSWGRRVGHDWATELNWTELRGVGWCGRWEGGSKGRVYMCTHCWFMLRFDRKQQNSVKQWSFNKKIIIHTGHLVSSLLRFIGLFQATSFLWALCWTSQGI